MNSDNKLRFYSNDFDYNRAHAVMIDLISKCNLKELIWIFRQIIYDQVAYWDDNVKSILYDGSYSKLTIEQANRFQSQLSTLLDLFEQSIIDKREFNTDYLRKYEFVAGYLPILNRQEEIIQKLKERINELVDLF